MAGKPQIKDWEQHFWEGVQVCGDDECWPWRRTINRVHGYGHLIVPARFSGERTRRSRGAHREAWRLANGVALDDLQVCHSCDNRPCCNPAHLFRGTAKDNHDDMRAKGRQNYHGPNWSVQGMASMAAKLSVDDVLAIRKLSRDGMSRSKAAAMFGVTVANIRQIVTRRTWRHV